MKPIEQFGDTCLSFTSTQNGDIVIVFANHNLKP